MHNIIKSVFNQAAKDTFLIIAIIVAFASHIFGLTLEFGGNITELNGGTLSMVIAGYIPTIVQLLLICVVARICGSDMNDKTINYEIMSGHSRAQVYFGRFIVALIYSLVLVTALFFVPVLIITAISGWGVYVPVQEMIYRFIISLFPVIRYTAFVTLITFLFNDGFKGMILGFVFVEGFTLVVLLIEEFAGLKQMDLLAMDHYSSAINISNGVYKVINGVEQMVLNSYMDTVNAIKIVAVSLIIGGVYLVIGYFIYRKKDI